MGPRFLLLALASLICFGSCRRIRFNRRNRPTLRGINGTRVELPCAINSLTPETVEDISWQKDGTVLTSGSFVQAGDGRLDIRVDLYSNTYTMIIEPARESDAG